MEKLSTKKPNPRNPRKPFTDSQLDAFRKSLAEFGDLSGIVFNRKSKQLVGGHKRCEQFREEDPEVHITEVLNTPDSAGTVAWGYVEIGGTRFIYREVEWAKTKEVAANLAANQHGADWEWQDVGEALKLIGTPEMQLMTGFEAHDIHNLTSAEWVPDPTVPMPVQKEKETPDMIILDKECRNLLNKSKKRMKINDDLEALKELCGKC